MDSKRTNLKYQYWHISERLNVHSLAKKIPKKSQLISSSVIIIWRDIFLLKESLIAVIFFGKNRSK